MDISIQEFKALLAGSEVPAAAAPAKELALGQNIVVLDRGFVYVGEVLERADRIRIMNAKNIRVWGTKNGLGELRTGPTNETKMDAVGEVIAYKRAVMHMIPCQGF